MPKFNQKRVEKTTPTHEKGVGYKQDPRIELVLLLASGTGDKFYEKENETFKRLDNLLSNLSKKDKLFIAKAIIYARAIIGQRSISHYAAAKLASMISGEEWAKRFFGKRDKRKSIGGVIYRLDDILEISAAYKSINKQERLKLSNAMKKGFASAIENSDLYEIAKYKGNGKEISLVDIVNLVHPKGEGETDKAIKMLMNGTLKQQATRQAANTETGKSIAAAVKSGEIKAQDKEKALKEAKSLNYRELLESRRIGYMDLVRNLKNIINTDVDLVPLTKSILLDREMIKKSLIFPHQIDLAIEVIVSESNDGKARREIINCLTAAYELSVENVKDLGMHGKTAVVFDTSSSMSGGWSSGVSLHNNKKSYNSPVEKAALIAATLGKGLNADIYQFASYCKEASWNPLDSVNTIANSLKKDIGAVGHGTEFELIFNKLSDRYDRVFIISDMQGADKFKRGLSNYKKRLGADPYIYSINLCGYSTTSIKPSGKVFPLAGYSSSIYEVAKKYEIDTKALISEILKIEF